MLKQQTCLVIITDSSEFLFLYVIQYMVFAHYFCLPLIPLPCIFSSSSPLKCSLSAPFTSKLYYSSDLFPKSLLFVYLVRYLLGTLKKKQHFCLLLQKKQGPSSRNTNILVLISSIWHFNVLAIKIYSRI